MQRRRERAALCREENERKQGLIESAAGVGTMGTLQASESLRYSKTEAPKQ